MKNGTDDLLELKVVERNERAKKLYRYVSDVARRVGEMTTACQSIRELFTMHIEIQRQKLRDNCEKLLFLDPLNYGKKSLELLWRKVYYDTVSAAKKLRETDSNYDNDLLTHLVAGIGHFHHFIMRIQTEFKVQYKELDYSSFYKDDDWSENESVAPITEEEVQLGQSILYSCLIYLGDLSRYETEIFHSFDSSVAARYYLQAAHIDLASGMPYNQLGNLYLDKNYNIDSVSYYIHCLNCETPFEGAMDNLQKIFEKNAQFIESINETESLTQAEHIQNTIVHFLSLIELWYLDKNDTNIPERCSIIAQELKMSMDFEKPQLPNRSKNNNEYVQAIEDENVNPSYLHPNIIHKIVKICLFTIQKTSETDESKAFACKAFTLALLSQILQKLLKDLLSIGLKNPASKYKARIRPSITEIELKATVEEIDDQSEKNLQASLTNDEVEISENEIDEDNDKQENHINGDVKNNTKKSVLKRRRRRRIMSSGSSDESGNDTENSENEALESCSDEEDSESDTLTTDEDSQSEDSDNQSSSETNKEASDTVNESPLIELNNTSTEPHKPEITINGTAHKDINDNKKTDNIPNKTAKEIDEDKLKQFLLGNNIMASIKLLQDWAVAEKDLILSCGDSGETLFQCVVDLLNIFTHNFVYKTDNHDCQILKTAKSLAKKLKLEYKTIPLPEDINLRGTDICKFDKNAAEWQFLDNQKLSVYEENMIRILNFVDFGNFIANIVPKIRFNRTMKIFYLKKVPAPKLTTKVNHKKSKEWHNSKKQHTEEGGLLRRLGRLWLTARVRELERAPPAAPGLLALTTRALTHHARRLRQLLRARCFVLLVPAVVLQELDNLKRTESAARDAIRWLERQLRGGSRQLRAQRPGQARPLPRLACPRRAPPHVHNFVQILEYCHHLVSAGGGEPAPCLVLLLGEPLADTYPEFSLSGAAAAAGVKLEHVEDFYTRCRHMLHKGGNKR